MRPVVRAMCARSFSFFVNSFGWQYNPQVRGETVGPFVLWDFQRGAADEIMGAIEGGTNIWVEKSRELGVSWLVLFIFLHRWLFRPFEKFLLMSRDKDSVDKGGDPDSLFWKLDFILGHLPDWLLPEDWSNKCRTSMSMVNPENGSVITGEASTGKAGIGGRATAILLDEFSQIRDDYEVLARTANTSDCRIFVATHKGTGTAFFDAIHGNLSKMLKPKVIRLHWTMHPEKRRGLYRWDLGNKRVQVIDTSYEWPADYDFVRTGAPAGGFAPGVRSPWYDKKAPELGSAHQVGMDLDIDPQGSASQFFDQPTVQGLKQTYVMEPVWVGDLDHDRSQGVPLGLSEGAGSLRLWVRPDIRGKLPPSEYRVGVDNATGSGATPTCFGIFDAVRGEKIGEYANPWIVPEDAALYCVALCRFLENHAGMPAMLVWEMAGPGLLFGQRVCDLQFTNVYYREEEFNGGRRRRTDRAGWSPQRGPKRLLLEEYRSALYARKFVNRSKEALDECLKFVYTPRGDPVYEGSLGDEIADPSGAGDNHGDRVIADALSWMIARDFVSRMVVDKPAEPLFGSMAWRRQYADGLKQASQNQWL